MLPWGQILTAGISIAEMAGKILSANKKKKEEAESKPSTVPADLLPRIEALESNEIKQSELVLKMAQQIMAVSKRSRWNFILACIGLGTAAISALLLILFLTGIFESPN